MNTSTSAWMSVPKSRISSRGCCAQGGWSPGLYERDGVDLHARGNTAKELRWNSGNPWKQGDRDGHHWGELSVPYQQRSIQSKLWFFPVVMYGCELDHKESWVPKNWCFWTVVLEKALESPLDCKEIQPVHPKGNQPWIFIGRTDAEAKAPIRWPPDDSLEKTLMLGKIVGGRSRGWQDEMVGSHHHLNGHELQ